MGLTFKFRKEHSSLLGTIYRPVAQVFFWSKKGKYWTEVWMIVDTGANYSILPHYLAEDLKINLQKETKKYKTLGIGGSQQVYFLPEISARLGKWSRKIPVGFLDSNSVPPLMGRHLFLETFEVVLSTSHKISFSSKK